MRLIDADLFDKELEEYSDGRWDGEYCACEDIRSMLEDAPTVNPYEWNEITYKVDECGSTVFDKGKPPFNTFVNVYCPDNKCIYTAYWSYSDRVWKEPYMMNDFNLRITHWMPLPAPPTEKEN